MAKEVGTLKRAGMIKESWTVGGKKAGVNKESYKGGQRKLH
jgi:hypothetical protein